MSTRKIFVRPNETLIIHVVQNDEPLNNKGWQQSTYRPHSFVMNITGINGITFSDPNLDIGLQVSTNSKRVGCFAKYLDHDDLESKIKSIKNIIESDVKNKDYFFERVKQIIGV